MKTKVHQNQYQSKSEIKKNLVAGLSLPYDYFSPQTESTISFQDEVLPLN